MKKILVPTDFSETANKARDYAIQLAKSFNAQVTLLNTYHVSSLDANYELTTNVGEVLERESNRAMNKQIEELEKTHPGIVFNSVCSYGFTVDSIKEHTIEHKFDLIVMGTIGATGFIGNLLGNTTSSLVGDCTIPIIVVPKDSKADLPKHIILATDLTHNGDEKLFDVLREIGMTYKAQIEFLFVDSHHQVEAKIAKLQARNFENHFDAKFHPFHFKKADKVEDEILTYIENKKFELLVVVSKKRNFLENLFHKSVSKTIINEANLPILVLPE